jgi:Carboxypeptidase regulatory-like domain
MAETVRRITHSYTCAMRLGGVSATRSARNGRFLTAAAFLVPAALIPVVAYLVVRGPGSGRAPLVRYADVQAIFNRSCVSCHPLVNTSLNLDAGSSYAALINTRAVEDPHYLRVVVGDPQKSFLYLKVAGFGREPAVGGRMPLAHAPLPAAEVRMIRDWISQGARGADGTLPPQSVATPGSPAPLAKLPFSTRTSGTGTIAGIVRDQSGAPIAGALVTLLLRGTGQPGGEEHYTVAMTDRRGSYTLRNAPAGRFELKAYAPRSVYVSHLVALSPGGHANVDFGLARSGVDTPAIRRAKIVPRRGGEDIQMNVSGTNLDPNYTLAVNVPAGRVFELHNPGSRAGVWSRRIPERLRGKWIFLAVDRLCSASAFITVRA